MIEEKIEIDTGEFKVGDAVKHHQIADLKGVIIGFYIATSFYSPDEMVTNKQFICTVFAAIAFTSEWSMSLTTSSHVLYDENGALVFPEGTFQGTSVYELPLNKLVKDDTREN